MTSDVVMLTLRHTGWRLTARVSTLGHVAEAERGGHRITVAGRSSEVAWLALWAKLTGPRRFVVSDRPRV